MFPDSIISDTWYVINTWYLCSHILQYVYKYADNVLYFVLLQYYWPFLKGNSILFDGVITFEHQSVLNIMFCSAYTMH